MNQLDRKQMLMNTLFNRHGSLVFSREACAKLLHTSTTSLDRLKDAGLGPKWTKDERSINGKVTYAIDHIVDYIIEQNINISA